MKKILLITLTSLTIAACNPDSVDKSVRVLKKQGVIQQQGFISPQGEQHNAVVFDATDQKDANQLLRYCEATHGKGNCILEKGGVEKSFKFRNVEQTKEIQAAIAVEVDNDQELNKPEALIDPAGAR